MLDLDQAIRERHSTRMFLPQQPVPRGLVDEALALAQLAQRTPSAWRCSCKPCCWP
jgi:nitroreductase